MSLSFSFFGVVASVGLGYGAESAAGVEEKMFNISRVWGYFFT